MNIINIELKNIKQYEKNPRKNDKSYKDKLTVPIIPFSKIKELGIGMYKGKKRDDNNE